MNTHDKTYLYYLKISIFPMVFFILLGILVWQNRLSVLNDKEHKEVSETIQNVIQLQAKKNMLLPKIVFINIDSAKKKEINSKFIDQISLVLTKKYLTEDTTKFSDIELKPFFVLPSKLDKSGNYILTEVQLNDLRNHLDFLTKQVDIEIDKAKEEIGRDIDRLNLWVTIWIGIIGFLGIFIPIIINIDTSKSAEKAIEKSEDAVIKSNDAITKINNAQTNIDKIDGIETRIGSAELLLGNIETVANESERISNEANINAEDALVRTERIENILTAINAIGNLKDIDLNTLQYITSPMALLRMTLRSIHFGLSNCTTQTDNPVVKDCLRQLGVRLQILTFYKFMKHDNTEMVNTFSGLVSEQLNNNYNEQNFNTILLELLNLADNLIID